MTDDSIWLISAVLTLITFSGFFSCSETALTAASRPNMHQLEKNGDKRAARVNRLIARREELIGAILLGNNLVNILASALATAAFIELFGQAGVVYATIVMTVIVLVFAEILPKTLAITHPDKIAMLVSGPASVLLAVLGWLAASIQFLTRNMMRLIGIRVEVDASSADNEIRGTIDLHHETGGVASQDRHMLVGALDLKELTVADVMVHRKNINMLDADSAPKDLVMRALSSQYTRLPLYRGDQDEIIGVLHAKDLLRAVAPLRGDLAKLEIDPLLREPWFVPETISVQDQLDAFLAKRNPFALVIDEYGALEGLVTLEDILEEIVGDIRDEHDIPVQGVRPQQDGSVIVDGWVTIRDLNRAQNWELPDEEAVTIAGLVIHEAQTIPEPNQRFRYHGYRFDILRKHRNQITALKVQKDDEPDFNRA